MQIPFVCVLPSQILRYVLLVIFSLFSLACVAAGPTGTDDGETSIPSFFNRPDILPAGGTLAVGKSLKSLNGKYEFKVQTDGNLVVYANGTAIWASQTNGNYSIKELRLQPNGDLVLFDNSGGVMWRSGTGGNDVSNTSYARYLMMSDSGILAIHGDTGYPAWSNAVRYNAVRFVARTIKNIGQDAGKLMCMDINQAGQGSGTNIQLWNCNNYASGDAQLFVYNTSDQTIRMLANQDRCVDVSGNSTTNGTNIQLWSCNGGNGQRFDYDKASGALRYKANTAKCIDINGSNRSTTDLNGTNIQLWDCNNTGSQRFDMVVGGSTGIPIWINYTTLIKRGQSHCIDRVNNGTTNGTNIQLYQCNDSEAQRFSYNKIDGTIRAANNQSKCMDVNGGNTGNDTNIQVWDCLGGDSQRFDFDLQTGEIKLRKAPNKCVDVAGGWNSNGTNIQLYDCNGSDAQKFDLAGYVTSTGGQVQRLSIDLRNVDDDVYVYVNGTQRIYSKNGNPGLYDIDPSWLVYGDNTIKVLLGNFGCWASSLTMALFRNMESVPAITRGIYLSSTSNCGYQADWRYNFNTATGRIRELQ